MKQPKIPFHPSYSPQRAGQMALARRPVLARAVRADVVTPPHGPVLVWGEPLIGKTTLIRQVLWSLEPDQFLVVRLPVGLLAELEGQQLHFGRVLADQARAQLDVDSPEPTRIAKSETFVDAINQCIISAESTGRMLVLAVEGLDAVKTLASRERVLQNLDYMFSIHPRLALILSSRLPHWQDSTVSFPPNMQIHFVPPLETEEARFLLTHPVQGQIEYGHESLLRLLAAAGGRPYLLQIIGRNCLSLLSSSGSTVVSSSETRQIVGSCWLAGERLFRPIMGYLTPAAQRTLTSVAVATAAQPAASLEAIEGVASQLGYRGDRDDLFQDLGRLRVWRIIADTPSDSFYVTCGWFGTYLRAGAASLHA